MARQTMNRACAVLLTLAASAAWAKPAPITSVVVYRDRAQVTRKQQASCAAGVIHFSGLPSTLHTKTLWATLSGGAGEVVGLTYKEEPTGPRPKAKTLQKQIRALDDRIVALDGEVKAARAVIDTLGNFRSHTHTIWGLQAAGKNPPVPSWEAALNLLRQRAVAAHKKQRQARTKQRGLRRERGRLAQELQLIRRQRRRTTNRVSVHLKCAGHRTVHLSYVVPGATWKMSYQFRADPARRRVTLVAQAAVAQGTGEDWDKVTVAVSTANLQRSNIPPGIARMRVTTNKPVDTRKILTRRFEHRRHLEVDKSKKSKKTEATTRKPPTAAGEPDKGLAMQLTAAHKASIPSDGRQVMVVLRRKEVASRHFLETVPKLYPYVYDKVEVRNPFDFPMLQGRVELFVGRSFIGQAQLKLRAPGEPFAFSLGVNNRLQVKRYVKKEKLKGASTFGSKKQLRHRYVIQLGNWANRPQKVRVLENVPVSQVREVKVALSDDSAKPTKWNKTDGILTWEVKLGPRSKKKLILDYTVYLPKSYIVYGYQKE